MSELPVLKSKLSKRRVIFVVVPNIVNRHRQLLSVNIPTECMSFNAGYGFGLLSMRVSYGKCECATRPENSRLAAVIRANENIYVLDVDEEMPEGFEIDQFDRS